MPKITLRDGTIIEVESPKEVAEILRELNAPVATPAAPAPEQPQLGSNGAGPSAEEEPSEDAAVDEGDESEESPEIPQRRMGGHWSRGAAHHLMRNVPDNARRLIEFLIDGGPKWVEGNEVAEATGIHTKGLGSIMKAVTRIAAAMGMTDPIRKVSRRLGRSRSTKLRLSNSFLVAIRPPQETPMTQ